MSAPRAVRAGTSTLAVVLGVAILLAVNWLGYRHWARGDWTRAQIYSLSETTKKIVAGLKAPVRITVVMTSRARLFEPVTELLNRYRALSPKIEVEIVDPEKQPRARRDARQGVRHPPGHGHLPLRRQEEVRRGGQARRLRLRRRRDGRRDPRDQGVQGRAGLHLRDPRGDGEQGREGLLHDRTRRADARSRRARARLLRGEAAARARQRHRGGLELDVQRRRAGRCHCDRRRGPEVGLPRAGGGGAPEVPRRRRAGALPARSGSARPRSAGRRLWPRRAALRLWRQARQRHRDRSGQRGPDGRPRDAHRQPLRLASRSSARSPTRASRSSSRSPDPSRRPRRKRRARGR